MKWSGYRADNGRGSCTGERARGNGRPSYSGCAGGVGACDVGTEQRKDWMETSLLWLYDKLNEPRLVVWILVQFIFWAGVSIAVAALLTALSAARF